MVRARQIPKPTLSARVVDPLLRLILALSISNLCLLKKSTDSAFTLLPLEVYLLRKATSSLESAARS